jgi:uncharacterized protein with ATP-grasp and redox domains
MKTSLECIPCFVRQTLGSARLISDDPRVHERVVREVLRSVADIDMQATPPQMGQTIHRLIRQATRNPDPFALIKRQQNETALRAYPAYKKRIEESEDPLLWAVRAAIAGNALDFAAPSGTPGTDVRELMDRALETPIVGNMEELRNATSEAREILYLADNAGEIVFDKLLIEQLGVERVVLGVRGHPTINDATRKDVEQVGLQTMVEVTDNGSDAPGTILDDCSETFRRRFWDADLIIAKGQGNFETLNEVNKTILFLLKAKCPVITDHLGCELNSFVVRYSDFNEAVVTNHQSGCDVSSRKGE